jgi:hypothetical protein
MCDIRRHNLRLELQAEHLHPLPDRWRVFFVPTFAALTAHVHPLADVHTPHAGMLCIIWGIHTLFRYLLGYGIQSTRWIGI